MRSYQTASVAQGPVRRPMSPPRHPLQALAESSGRVAWLGRMQANADRAIVQRFDPEKSDDSDSDDGTEPVTGEISPDNQTLTEPAPDPVREPDSEPDSEPEREAPRPFAGVIADNGFERLGEEVLTAAAHVAGADPGLFVQLCTLSPSRGDLGLSSRAAALLRALARGSDRPVTSGLLTLLRSHAAAAPMRSAIHSAWQFGLADQMLTPTVLRGLGAVPEVLRKQAVGALRDGCSLGVLRTGAECANGDEWLFDMLLEGFQAELDAGLAPRTMRLVRMTCLPGQRPLTPTLMSCIMEFGGAFHKELLFLQACEAIGQDAPLALARLQPLMAHARHLVEDAEHRERAFAILKDLSKDPAAYAPFAFREDQFDKATALGEAAWAKRTAKGTEEVEAKQKDFEKELLEQAKGKLSGKMKKWLEQSANQKRHKDAEARLKEHADKLRDEFFARKDLGEDEHAAAADEERAQSFEKARDFFAEPAIGNDPDAAFILGFAKDEMQVARGLIEACRKADGLRPHVRAQVLGAEQFLRMLAVIKPTELVQMLEVLPRTCTRAFATGPLPGCLSTLFRAGNVAPEKIADVAKDIDWFGLAKAPHVAGDLARVLGALSVSDTKSLLIRCQIVFGSKPASLAPLAEIAHCAAAGTLLDFIDYAQDHFIGQQEILAALKPLSAGSNLKTLIRAVLDQRMGDLVGAVDGYGNVEPGQFTPWLNVVALQLQSDFVTLEVPSAWTDLGIGAKGSRTWEKTCIIWNGPDKAQRLGTFVVHDHPGVKEDPPYTSKTHAKPNRHSDVRINHKQSSSKGFWNLFG